MGVGWIINIFTSLKVPRHCTLVLLAQIELFCIKGLFKNSFSTPKKAWRLFITKISQSMLYREIIILYSENLTKHTNIKFGITGS